MSKPFVIFSLPRSRSTWLSHFLSYGEVKCHHDKSLEFGRIEDIGELLQSNVGIADTALALLWREVRVQVPEAKFMVVRRPRVEVEASLAKMGLRSNPKVLKALDLALDEIASCEATLCVSFKALHSVAVCRTVFEFCLEKPFDWEWWAMLAHCNIQPKMQSELGRIAAHATNFERLYAPALARI